VSTPAIPLVSLRRSRRGAATADVPSMAPRRLHLMCHDERLVSERERVALVFAQTGAFMAEMPESSLIEAIMMTRAQVDFLWQFFVTVHIAVFALLFIYDEAVESMNAVARVLAVVGIAMFDWINGKALQNTYLLLDAMQDQYRALFGQVERFRPAFYEQFVLASFANRPDIVYVTHGMAFVVVILALSSRHFIQSRRRRSL